MDDDDDDDDDGILVMVLLLLMMPMKMIRQEEPGAGKGSSRCFPYFPSPGGAAAIRIGCSRERQGKGERA